MRTVGELVDRHGVSSVLVLFDFADAEVGKGNCLNITLALTDRSSVCRLGADVIIDHFCRTERGLPLKRLPHHHDIDFRITSHSIIDIIVVLITRDL